MTDTKNPRYQWSFPHEPGETVVHGTDIGEEGVKHMHAYMSRNWPKPWYRRPWVICIAIGIAAALVYFLTLRF